MLLKYHYGNGLFQGLKEMIDLSSLKSRKYNVNFRNTNFPYSNYKICILHGLHNRSYQPNLLIFVLQQEESVDAVLPSQEPDEKSSLPKQNIAISQQNGEAASADSKNEVENFG